MKVETLIVSLISSGDKQYNKSDTCQCCGQTIRPVKQKNGIDYYFIVGNQEDYGRSICPQCLESWLGKLGQGIANDPVPRWLHATIQ